MSPTFAPRARREIPAGIVQVVYIVVGAAVGLILPTIDVGPMSTPESVSGLVLGIAGGFISFIALVFSLLFLVVQYGNTAVSPRLTLFRDAPIVGHSFGMFLGVFAYATAAGIQVGTRDQDVSIVVPLLAIALVIVALWMSRSLQMRALHQLQFPATMEEIRRRGAEVIERVHRHPFSAGQSSDDELPPVRATIVWERATTTLRQIDGPRLLAEAGRFDAVIELHVAVGGELARGATVATVRADRPLDGSHAVHVERAFDTGVDRAFAQDPLLAFRLLSDIGNRALSAATNDPATAVQVLACVQDLLVLVAGRRLDAGLIYDGRGRPRLRLRLPSWDEYLHAAVDEIAYYGRHAPTVRERTRELLETVLEHAPPERRPAVERRLATLGAET